MNIDKVIGDLIDDYEGEGLDILDLINDLGRRIGRAAKRSNYSVKDLVDIFEAAVEAR